MADLYRVEDKTLSRPVVLKVLQPRFMTSATAASAFLRESLIGVVLDVPGVVPVYDRGLLAGERPWFTMREVRGQTIGELLDASSEDRDPIWLRRQVDHLRQACRTVAFAHERGIVHRDLSPRNLMLSDSGEVLVLDWGLAGITADSTLAADFDKVPLRGGTPGFVAPEQQNGAPPASSADVYALGALLQRIVDAVPSSDTPRGEWAELRGLARSAHATDPALRPQNAGVLQRELSKWLDGSYRREQADSMVRAALRHRPRIAAAEEARVRFRHSAEAILGGLPAHAPDSAKRAAWSLEDEAAEQSLLLARMDAEFTHELNAALVVDPGHPGAMVALAEYLNRAVDSRRAHPGRHQPGAPRGDAPVARSRPLCGVAGHGWDPDPGDRSARSGRGRGSPRDGGSPAGTGWRCRSPRSHAAERGGAGPGWVPVVVDASRVPHGPTTRSESSEVSGGRARPTERARQW